MHAFTQGPWTVNTADYKDSIGIECNVNGIDHTVVTDQFCYPNFQQHGSEEKLANAKLIAAAPELLDVIEKILSFCHGYELLPLKMIEVFSEAEKIIEKATK